MLFKSGYNIDLFVFFLLKIWNLFFGNFEKQMICVFVFSVCFGLHIDILIASMRSSVIFCIYEHILKYVLGVFRMFEIFEF